MHILDLTLLALATPILSVATAIAPPGPDRQAPLLHHAPTNRTVSAELFTELEELARVIDISYCVGITGFGISKPFSCLSRCSEFPDFELVTAWNTGQLLSDSCGYIALDHGKKRVLVAFRGTYSVANTVVDLSTIPQEYVPYPADGDDGEPGDHAKCTNCTVHMGFHTAWRHTRDHILDELLAQLELYPEYRLNLVGHSLGGAVAALAALELNGRGYDPLITTFGEPRIGNANLVKFLDDCFNLLRPNSTSDDVEVGLRYRRITHMDDPVPLLPLSEWGYGMHAGEIYISKSSLSPDINDLQHCAGDTDQLCIAGQDATTAPDTVEGASAPPSHSKRDLISSVSDEIHDVVHEPWGIPSRYKLWQLFFAHRDYFWRLGLCVPGGDPLGGGEKYASGEELEVTLKGDLR